MQFFFEKSHHTFHCPVRRDRCQAFNTHTKRRCHRHVVIGVEYCWQHRVQRHQIKIKPSDMKHAGLGLFVHDEKQPPGRIVFRGGDIIYRGYSGQILTKKQLDERYGTGLAVYGLRNRVRPSIAAGALHTTAQRIHCGRSRSPRSSVHDKPPVIPRFPRTQRPVRV
jgi:hypothetical protein